MTLSVTGHLGLVPNTMFHPQKKTKITFEILYFLFSKYFAASSGDDKLPKGHKFLLNMWQISVYVCLYIYIYVTLNLCMCIKKLITLFISRESSIQWKPVFLSYHLPLVLCPYMFMRHLNLNFHYYQIMMLILVLLLYTVTQHHLSGRYMINKMTVKL